MKKIDIKSIIIGVLGTALIFVTMGATKQNNEFGDISVKSIKVLDENGRTVTHIHSDKTGGVLAMASSKGDMVIGIAASEYGGDLFLYNNDGNAVVMLSADEFGGSLDILTPESKSGVQLGITEGGGGGINIFNKYEKEAVVLQASNDQDGLLALYGRNGDVGWLKTGKK